MTENIYNIGTYVTFVETATGNEPGYLKAAVRTVSHPGRDHRYLSKSKPYMLDINHSCNETNDWISMYGMKDVSGCSHSACICYF